jgi:hypothetical protein
MSLMSHHRMHATSFTLVRGAASEEVVHVEADDLRKSQHLLLSFAVNLKQL